MNECLVFYIMGFVTFPILAFLFVVIFNRELWFAEHGQWPKRKKINIKIVGGYKPTEKEFQKDWAQNVGFKGSFDGTSINY